jgi:cellulose synthase/poly-beta-1,6-N-acetylglucosamine synthase-like glycosyltransferase
MRKLLFWGSAALVAYTYAGFPLLVLARARLRPRPVRTADWTPPLTLVIAARNEAAVIAQKLDNIFGLDYPAERLQVVVASDGSEDGTDDIVRGYEQHGVTLVPLPRVGKAAALNAALAVATGEIVVFSDANSIYAPNALRALVRPFADPEVGGAAGDQRYVAAGADGAAASGELRYWSLDRMLKEAESCAGNVISATGAIYAVRRGLLGDVPGGVTDDFTISTGVIAKGHRLVFVREAVAFEPVAPRAGLEFDRKVRVMTRGLRGVLLRRELLDPRLHGFYALQLFSHKVLRRVMVVPLLALAASSPLLWRRSRFYRLATAGQVLLYGAGTTGLLLADKPLARRQPFGLAAFFVFVNAASLRAIWNIVRGHRIERWEPAREVRRASDRGNREPADVH